MSNRFHEWMKKQPRQMQDEILGEKNGEMFRRGKLDLRRYTPRRGNELNVHEAKRRDVLAAAFDQGAMPIVAFINEASQNIGVELDQLVHACQKYLDTMFVPVWGFPAKCISCDSEEDSPDGAWLMLMLDDADAADALGYHDLTKLGLPVSKVFVNDVLRMKQRVSTTVSHELVEMLLDPAAQLWAQADDGTLYAYEASDAVEGEEFQVDGVWMQDFVYPAFFESFHEEGSKQFDYLNKVKRPFQTLTGGYQIFMKGGKVKTVFGSKAKMANFKEEDRRMHRSEYRKAMANPDVSKRKLDDEDDEEFVENDSDADV